MRRVRARAVWTAIRGGDAVARVRVLRDGQAALRLNVGAAGVSTGVLDALAAGPAETTEVAARTGIREVALLEAFLRVLEAAGHVRSCDGRWQLRAC